jgi:hypothetical protein
VEGCPPRTKTLLGIILAPYHTHEFGHAVTMEIGRSESVFSHDPPKITTVIERQENVHNHRYMYLFDRYVPYLGGKITKSAVAVPGSSEGHVSTVKIDGSG